MKIESRTIQNICILLTVFTLAYYTGAELFSFFPLFFWEPSPDREYITDEEIDIPEDS